jgi:hypothetical protein
MNAINARLKTKLEPPDAERLVADLVRRGVIAVVDGKVSYP